MHGRAGGSIMFFFDCCRQGRAAGVQGPLAPGSPFAIALSLSVHQFYFSALSADREERRALTYPIRKRRRPRLAVGVSCSKAPSTPRAPSLARRRRQLSARDFEIYVLPASRSQRDASTSFHSSFPLPTSYALQTVHTTLHYTTQPSLAHSHPPAYPLLSYLRKAGLRSLFSLRPTLTCMCLFYELG